VTVGSITKKKCLVK